MSKWVNTDKFKEFAKKKQEEAEQTDSNGGGTSFFPKWNTPKGYSTEKPTVYKIRFLPDKNGDFYKKYFYHFVKSGEKSYLFKCLKTESWDNYCPWCHAGRILYQGSSDDKQKAKQLYRKTRYVGNIYIIDDPRDSQAEESRKVGGTVRLYEFPATIEGKIRTQITDEEEGRGAAIFDPEEGYNFLVKVALKKPDADGTQWPTYEMSEFSLNKNAISDNSEKIKEIMDSVYDLTEYLNSIDMDVETHKKLLKQEMLWEDVQDQFEKYLEGKQNTGESAVQQMDKVFDGDSEESSGEESNDEPTNTQEGGEEEQQSSEDEDRELLNELENL